MCIIGGEFIRNKEDTKCIADKHNVLNQIILGTIKDSACVCAVWGVPLNEAPRSSA
jgi:hypothetical protein